MARLSGPNQFAPAVDSLTRHATAQATVGHRISNADGAYVYVTAGGAITTSGDPVSAAGGLNAVVRGDLDVGAFLGIAEAPFASGESGYIRVQGPTTAVVESGAAAGSLIELSGNVGKLKPITTSGRAVGCMLAASDDAGAALKAIYLF
jgi:hypothetical protein